VGTAEYKVKLCTLSLFTKGLLKPAGNVGQRAHINFILRFSQFYKALKSIQLDSPNVMQ